MLFTVSLTASHHSETCGKNTTLGTLLRASRKTCNPKKSLHLGIYSIWAYYTILNNLVIKELHQEIYIKKNTCRSYVKTSKFLVVLEVLHF